MATFNIEDAAFSGVGLLARRPGAALIWAVLWAVLVGVVTVPFVGELAQLVTLAVRSGSNSPDPQAIMPLLPALGAFWLLSWILGLALGAVISCAVYRALYFPDDSAFAYLRLGELEIHVLLVNFAKGLVLFVASVGLSMVLAVILIITGQMGGGATGPVALIGRLALQCVVFWLQLRLAMSGPMTFVEGRFRLFESWAATEGQSVRLLVVGVVLALIVIVVYLALATLGFAVGLGMWNSMPRPADVQDLLSQAPSVWMAPLAPFIILTGFLVLIGGAILTPITIAPWAHIYRSLAGGDEPAETFT